MVCCALFAFTAEQSKLYFKYIKEIAADDDNQDSDDSEEDNEEDSTETFEFSPKFIAVYRAEIITHFQPKYNLAQVATYQDSIPESVVIRILANPPEMC